MITVQLTVTQDIPSELRDLIADSGGEVTGLVCNHRDEFVDISFTAVLEADTFQMLLRKEGYSFRRFANPVSAGHKSATFRVFA